MKKILLALVLIFCFAVPYAAQAQIVVVVHHRRHHRHYRHRENLRLDQYVAQ